MQPWSWQIARAWFPANIVFVAMLWTSFPALQLLGVGMVTVLKNLTNLFTIFGDIIFFDKSYGKGGLSIALSAILVSTMSRLSRLMPSLRHPRPMGRGVIREVHQHVRTRKGQSRAPIVSFHGAGVWATLALMSVSALCGAFTDLNFNGKGYAWQLLNCCLTAGYSLSLRGIMDKVRLLH